MRSHPLLRTTLPVLLAACLLGPAHAWAYMSSEQNAMRKLGRGVANIVSSPVEVLNDIQQVYLEEGAMAAMTTGTMCGVADGLIRAAVGVFEIGTFPAPMPGVGYGPIVEPEFLLHPEDVYTLDLTLTR